MNKDSWAQALVEARHACKEIAMAKKEDWEANERLRIKERFEGTQESALELVEKELRDSFLTFVGTDAMQNDLGMTEFTFKYGNNTQPQSYEEECKFVYSRDFLNMVNNLYPVN